MVVVPERNGSLCICLDPKDLNRAVQHHHYPLPTIEGIATMLHGTKVFTIVDVKNGFWHVVLDDQSSYLTTFRQILSEADAVRNMLYPRNPSVENA